MPEWLIGAVLKTVERASVPWVRIPLPPNLKALRGFFYWENLCFKIKDYYLLTNKFANMEIDVFFQDSVLFGWNDYFCLFPLFVGVFCVGTFLQIIISWSPESPNFEPTSLNFCKLCPNSVHKRVLVILRASGIIFHLKWLFVGWLI